MNLLDILTKICEEINNKFINDNIYIAKVPEGFKRPSFFVSIINFNDKDLSNQVLNRDTAFQIVYFAPIDKRNNIDIIAQYSAYITLSQIFQHQGLQVKDRNIKITSINGGPRDAEVYLTVNFNYSFVPEDVIDPTILYEKVQDLQLKYIKN